MEESIKAALVMALFERTPVVARRLVPQATWDLPHRNQELFLTFDDGPDARFTGSLLDLLAALQVHATFFLIGEKARAQPQLVRRIVAGGHAIGNHTMHHPYLRWHRQEVVRHEMQAAQQVLEDVSGCRVGLFRPPYGVLRPVILRTAKELQLRIAMWSLLTGDVWRHGNPGAIAATIVKRVRGGDIVLLHDGHRCSPATIAALHEGIPTLKEQGFHFAALPDDLSSMRT